MKKKNGGFYSRETTEREQEELREKVGEYASMSSDELLDELFAQAAAARRRGDLDDKKLNEFYNGVYGMLDAAQRRKLDMLMQALRSH